MLIVGSSNGQVLVLDSTTGAELAALDQLCTSKGPVNIQSIALDQDNQALLTGVQANGYHCHFVQSFSLQGNSRDRDQTREDHVAA